MTLTNAWNEAVPTDENYGFELDDFFRRLCTDVRERAAVQHQAYADETGKSDIWEHSPGKCTITYVGTKASFPTPATSTKGCMAVATDETNQLYYWNGTGWAKVQEPVLITGDQAAIAGAKTFTGVVTLGDTSKLTTDAAPTANAQIANKKYVDDQVAAVVDAVVQVVQASYPSMNQIGDVIVSDDSIPQNYEGAQILTLAITPSSATNLLKIEAIVPGGFDGNTGVTVALFQDLTADALAVAYASGLTTERMTIPLMHWMTAGTTDETTFKIRVGVQTAGQFTVNGAGGGRLYGGVSRVQLVITEIRA